MLGRRPQRQVAGVRAGLGAGHRPPPDRDVFAPDPHGRPYRGAAARRHGRLRRLPQSHAWAVTVTGAPKLWAMRFIENNEKSPRAWYGGAIGMVHFNGDLNTGLTLRTIRIKDGIAEVRAGATLLYRFRSREEEEAETELKASAMISAIRDAKAGNSRQHRTLRPPASATASTSCSSTTRTASSTRWPTISARPAPTSRPCARRCRTRCSTG